MPIMKLDESAGQERGVEADDVGGVKGVQAEACACTDRVDSVCSWCHSRLSGNLRSRRANKHKVSAGRHFRRGVLFQDAQGCTQLS